MIVSESELLAAARKAATGAGCPAGIADEISRATVWLCRHGLDGVGAALAGLQDADAAPPRLLPGHQIAFGDARAAMHGPSAIDLLVAGAAPDGITMHDLDSALLLVGLTGVAATAHAQEFVLQDRAGNRTRVSSSGPSGDLHLDPMEVRVHGAAPQDSRPVGERESARLTSLNVDDQLWSCLNTYAARTYVPATEQSRIAGAGAGLTDND